MVDEELGAACTVIENYADQLKQLLQDGAAEEEINALVAKLDVANANLRQLLLAKTDRRNRLQPE